MLNLLFYKLQRIEEVIDLSRGCLRAIGAVNHILFDRSRIEASDGAFGRLLGIRCAHQLPEPADDVLSFENKDENRSGAHIGGQIVEETSPAVNSVEPFSLRSRQMQHAGCFDLESICFEESDDISDVSLCNSVRLYNGQRAFQCHSFPRLRLLS
jgi:hypothetical protein